MADIRRFGSAFVRGVAGLACVVLGVALGWLTRSLEPRSPETLRSDPSQVELATLVTQATEGGEIAHEITAVLLDFRGYDTLLEVAVLVLALTSAWGLFVHAPDRAPGGTPSIGGEDDVDASGILDGLVDVVAPVALLLAAYLGWTGMWAPGGAFQAGAVLAAVGVLLIVAHRIDPRRGYTPLPDLAAVAGLWIFLGVALGTMVAGHRFLEYPAGWLKPLVSLIEASLAISIAAILATLFAGAYAAFGADGDTHRTRGGSDAGGGEA